MLSTVAASAFSVAVVSSWKLDSSSTHTSGWFTPRSSTTSSTAGEMLPAATASLPAALHRCSTMLVTVVLPFAPVIARMCGRLSLGSDCANNSMSPTTATPRATAFATAGSRNGTPGLMAISSMPSNSAPLTARFHRGRAPAPICLYVVSSQLEGRQTHQYQQYRYDPESYVSVWC